MFLIGKRMSMLGRIFINYRRSTSAVAAGRLADRLMEHFDRNQVFLDVDTIEPGVDFVKTLHDQVAQCSAFIVVINPGWVDASNSVGKRRLDDPDDYVRVEIEAALKRDIRVIPVLVDGAQMVRSEDLPDPLKPLVHRQAFEITNRRFVADADELALALQRGVGLRPTLQRASAFVDKSAFVDRSSERQDGSWAELLFSFKGRITRKQFWLTSSTVISTWFVCFFALSAAWAVALFIEKHDIDRSQAEFETIWKEAGGFISLLSMLPFMWPWYALYLKRLHDFGQGWALFFGTVLPGWLAYPLLWAGYENAFWNIQWGFIGAGIILCCVKGTPGPNRFGPDPLTRAAQSSTKDAV